MECGCNRTVTESGSSWNNEKHITARANLLCNCQGAILEFELSITYLLENRRNSITYLLENRRKDVIES